MEVLLWPPRPRLHSPPNDTDREMKCLVLPPWPGRASGPSTQQHTACADVLRALGPNDAQKVGLWCCCARSIALKSHLGHRYVRSALLLALQCHL